MDWLSSREKKIFLTVFLLVGLFVQWYGVNANSRLDLTRSIVDRGEFAIEDLHRNTGDRSLYNETYYSDKEPGMAFLAIPAYGLLKSAANPFIDTDVRSTPRKTMFEVNNVTVTYPTSPGPFYLSVLPVVIWSTSTLSLAALSILVYRLSADFLEDEKKRLLTTFGFSLGTIVTHYGALFMPNAVVSFLSFSSFYIVYRSDGSETRNLLLAGVIGGLSVVVDPTGIVGLVAVFLYLVYNHAAGSWPYFIGGFLGGLPLMIYNTWLFGLPWMLPRFFLDPALYPQIQQTATNVPKLLQQGFRPELARMASASVRMLFYPYRGLFYWFPFLAVTFLGLRELREETDLLILAASSLGLSVLLVSGWWAWWMGGFFGIRYISVAVPFMMIAVFLGAKRLDNSILALLVAASILVNLSGFQGGYEDALKDLENSSEMEPEYQKKLMTLEPLANPVKNHYIQGLLEKGPQSRILNGLYHGEAPPDIRAYSGPEERAPPLLLYWVITLIPTVIWRNEIRSVAANYRGSVRRETE